MFPPLVWSVDRESTPDDVCKVRMLAELSTADLQTKGTALVAEVKNMCTPAYAYQSTDSPSTFQSPIPTAFQTVFCPQLNRKEGPDDIWEFKFSYTFALKYNSRRIFPTRFRGCLGLRSPIFGPWEPYSFIKCRKGAVNNSVFSENHTNYSVFEVNHVTEISGQSLSTKFTPNDMNLDGCSNRNLEVLILLQFYKPKARPASKSGRSVIVGLEMRSATLALNFLNSEFKTDCTIQLSENQKYFCHSDKIKSASIVLRRLFDADSNSTASSRITKDWSSYFSSSDAVQCFLKFIYFHEIPSSKSVKKPNSFEILFELLQFAHMFDIPFLRKGTEVSMCDHPCLVEEKVTVDFAFGFEVYTFARRTETLKNLQRCMRLALHKLSSRDPENKDRLVQLARTYPESIVEILL